MKRILTSLLFLGTSILTLNAQQLPLSNIYNKNRMLLNPGNTGDAAGLAGFLNHRKQWMNTAGSPSAQFLGVHAPISENLSLGGLIQNMEIGLLRQTSATMNYAYSLTLADEHNLRFGLGASFIQNYINMADAIVQDPSEYGLYNGDLNNYSFNSSFGVVYNWRELEVGFALPNFIPFNSNRVHPNDNPFHQVRTSMMAHASYKYEFDNNIMVQPLVVMRLTPNASWLLDNWVTVDYKNIVWLNLAYRSQTNASFIVGAGTWLTKNLNMNYAYEYGRNRIGTLSAGTHEISLGILFSETQTINPYAQIVRDTKPPRRPKKLKEPKEDKKGSGDKGKKKITIITDGYSSGGNDSPEIEFRIKPKEGPVQKVGADAAPASMRTELDDMKRKLDMLLKSDNMSKSDLKMEFDGIRKQLNKLLEQNSQGEAEKVSGELDEVSKRIELLKQKIEATK